MAKHIGQSSKLTSGPGKRRGRHVVGAGLGHHVNLANMQVVSYPPAPTAVRAKARRAPPAAGGDHPSLPAPPACGEADAPGPGHGRNSPPAGGERGDRGIAHHAPPYGRGACVWGAARSLSSAGSARVPIPDPGGAAAKPGHQFPATDTWRASHSLDGPEASSRCTRLRLAYHAPPATGALCSQRVPKEFLEKPLTNGIANGIL